MFFLLGAFGENLLFNAKYVLKKWEKKWTDRSTLICYFPTREQHNNFVLGLEAATLKWHYVICWNAIADNGDYVSLFKNIGGGGRHSKGAPLIDFFGYQMFVILWIY